MPVLKQNKPLALTCGDPEGIGIEITHKAWNDLRETSHVFFVIGPTSHFSNCVEIDSPQKAINVFAKKIPVLAIENNKIPAQTARQSLEIATKLVLENKASAIITNPVNKARLSKIGFQFAGQTEYLSSITNSDVLMMLANKNLRCALVTTHLPLRLVSSALNIDKIVLAGKILVTALKNDFGIAKPNIAIAALNPHAGDGRILGDEEEEIIAPASKKLNALGIGNFTPPLPADTMFNKKNIDAFLCMFHDQALIPIKIQSDEAVNISLGLPIIRTSPDHGTGFDIVGKNIAQAESLIEAIKTASQLVKVRNAK